MRMVDLATFDLSAPIEHFDIHNRTEGKVARRLSLSNGRLGIRVDVSLRDEPAF